MAIAVDGSGDAKLVAEGIHVHFEGVRAVDGVDLTLERGQIMGLIGPNGAGKTTFMNAVSSFVSLTAGRVVLGRRRRDGLAAAAARQARPRAHVPGRRHVPGPLRVRERGARRARRRPLAAAGTRRGLGAAREARPAPRGGRCRHRRSRTARSGASASPAPSPLARASCCSTSRRQASTTRRACSWPRRSPASATTSAAACSLVEHDMRIIFRVCERIQVLDYGKSIAVGSPDEIRREQAGRRRLPRQRGEIAEAHHHAEDH